MTNEPFIRLTERSEVTRFYPHRVNERKIISSYDNLRKCPGYACWLIKYAAGGRRVQLPRVFAKNTAGD